MLSPVFASLPLPLLPPSSPSASLVSPLAYPPPPVFPMSPASSGAAASSPRPCPRFRKLWSDGNAVTRLLMAVACMPACLRTPMASYITCHKIAVDRAEVSVLARVKGEGAKSDATAGTE